MGDGPRTLWRRWRPRKDGRAAEVAHLGGLLSVRAPSSLLRRWAVQVATTGDDTRGGMSSTGLEHPRWELCRGDGEVQTLHDYHRRVSIATISRREVLATGNAPAIRWNSGR